MIEPAPGVLLIADPFLKDPNFLRSVVFLCEHKTDGSFGFVLNRRFETNLNELVPSLSEFDLPVYYGGPVQPDTLHFVHQYPDKIPGGTEITSNIYWGGNFEVLGHLLRTGEISPSKIRFFVGYSGWDSGQLDAELEGKSWLTVKATRQLVFHRDPNQLWQDSLRALGGDYEMMIHFPIDPQLN